MRSIGDPDFEYRPWTEERRKARSDQARRRAAMSRVNVTYSHGPHVEQKPSKAIVINRPFPLPKAEWSTPKLIDLARICRSRSEVEPEILFLFDDDIEFALNDPRELCGIHLGDRLFEFRRRWLFTPGYYEFDFIGAEQIKVYPVESPFRETVNGFTPRARRH